MGVQFGSCSEPTNKINRAYTLGGANTFAPYGSVDVINPVIIVGESAVSPTNNVMYISDYGRYYNITGIQFDGKRAIVSGAVDVARTYAGNIYSTQYVSRSSTGYHLDIPDNLLPIAVGEIPKVVQFGDPVSTSTTGYVIGLTKCKNINRKAIQQMQIVE